MDTKHVGSGTASSARTYCCRPVLALCTQNQIIHVSCAFCLRTKSLFLPSFLSTSAVHQSDSSHPDPGERYLYNFEVTHCWETTKKNKTENNRDFMGKAMVKCQRTGHKNRIRPKTRKYESRVRIICYTLSCIYLVYWSTIQKKIRGHQPDHRDGQAGSTLNTHNTSLENTHALD